MISVIIPIYNEARSIGSTLRSLSSQTVKDIEIIVVDDGSTDDLSGALSSWMEAISLVRLEQNNGRQAARNTGLARACGEYLFVCDADILLLPTCLEKMLRALDEHQECSYAYSAFCWGRKEFRSYPFDSKRLKQMNYINTASLVRAHHHPGFDEKVGKLQDWDVWLTMLGREQRGVYIPEVLFSLGQHKGGLSAWLPSFFYRIPWRYFGIRIKQIDSYEYWKRYLMDKHKLLYNSRASER